VLPFTPIYYTYVILADMMCVKFLKALTTYIYIYIYIYIRKYTQIFVSYVKHVISAIIGILSCSGYYWLKSYGSIFFAHATLGRSYEPNVGEVLAAHLAIVAKLVMEIFSLLSLLLSKIDRSINICASLLALTIS